MVLLFFRHWISNTLYTSNFTLVHPCSCHRNSMTTFYAEGAVEKWYSHLCNWLVLLQNTNEVFLSVCLSLFPLSASWKEIKRLGTWIKYKFKKEESPLQRICWCIKVWCDKEQPGSWWAQEVIRGVKSSIYTSRSRVWVRDSCLGFNCTETERGTIQISQISCLSRESPKEPCGTKYLEQRSVKA